MGDEKQLGSGRRQDWPVVLGGMVGGFAGGGLAFLVGNLTNLRGFLPGLLVFLTGLLGGIYLGRLVGSLLFRGPPSKGPGA